MKKIFLNSRALEGRTLIKHVSTPSCHLADEFNFLNQRQVRKGIRP